MTTAPTTAVIPTYNSAGTFPRALASVAAQSLQPAEVIVVDDASAPDEADQIRDAWTSSGLPGRFIRLRDNVGPGAARNLAWARARTPFVSFLDSDDAWHPDKLAIETPVLERENPALLCSRIGRGCGAQVPWPDPGSVAAHRVSRAVLLAHNPAPTPTATVRRSIPPSFGVDFLCEDYYAWFAVARFGPVFRIPAVLAARYKEAMGESGLSGDMRRMARDEVLMLWRARQSGYVSTPELVGCDIALAARLARRFVKVAIRRA